MAKKRISRKSLKGPDELVTQTERMIEWTRSNIKQVIVGGCAIFALIALAGGYWAYSAHREQAAAALLSRTVSEYQDAMRRENDPNKILATVKPDFEKLIDRYGRQPAGRLGRIIFAHAALTGHDPQQAIALYRKALPDFDGNQALVNTIRNGLASAYLQKGDSAAAIEQFSKIAESTSTVLKDVAFFHLGYLYGAAGQAEKSQAAYRQLRTDFPDSFYAEMAQEKSAG